MGKVIYFNGITRLDLPPDRILEEAKGTFEGVVLLGWNNDGKMYFASSYSDGGTVLWLLEQCKKALLDIDGER